jgi:ligand-binding sensor domain-containing protein
MSRARLSDGTVRLRSLLAWCVALLGFGVPLSGQHYNFKLYGQEEGLGDLSVECLVQDRTGFIWIGTRNGLFRFDGRQFREYGPPDGLPSSKIFDLKLAVDGSLWVLGSRGPARWIQDRFEATGFPEQLTAEERPQFAFTSQGQLAISSRKGLWFGQPKDGTWAWDLRRSA